MKKKQMKTYKKEYDKARQALKEAAIAYRNLESKYSIAIDRLRSISCQTVDSDSPEKFSFDTRMAWSAAKTLGILSQKHQALFPYLGEFNL